MAVVPIDSSQKAMVLEPYDSRVTTMWTSKVMNELSTRGLLDSEEKRELENAEGRKVLDFLLVSSDGDACDKFCQSIATSDCGESLARQLQEKFELKRKRAIRYDEMKSGRGYDPDAFSPKEAFAELVQSVEEALDGVMDLGDLRLFSVTLTSHRERTGGLDPLNSDKVDNASSVSQIFRMLRPYWTWDDFNILEKIVDISNCPKAQLLIQEFLRKRRKFLGEDVKPAPVTYRSIRDGVVAKLAEERNCGNARFEVLKTIVYTERGVLPLNHMLHLREVMMEVFDLPEHQIHFAGHMQSEAETLLWLVPEEDIQRILPLAYTNRAKLREMDVQRVEVGKNISYHVRDDNYSYNDSKTTPEVQQFREQISRMQEVATHEWGLLQDLHGCMVDPGISLLERGYHDYKRHMDFVLSVQLDKVKLPMENEYIGGFKPGPEVIHTDQWPESMWRCGRHLQFKGGPKMPFAMAKVTAVEIGEQIWCIPGWTSTLADRDKVVAYDYSKEVWSPPVKCPQYRATGVRIGDRLVVIGGITVETDEVTNNLVLLDPLCASSPMYKWETSSALPPMPTKRFLAGAVVYENYLVVVGGRAVDRRSVLDVVEVLEIAHHFPPLWYEVTSLPRPLWGPSLAMMGHRLYLAGSGPSGRSLHKEVYSACITQLVHSYYTLEKQVLHGGYLDRAEETGEKKNEEKEDEEDYSKLNGAEWKVWHKLTDLDIYDPVLVVFSQRLLAIGGIDTERFRANSTLYAYNTRENTWKRVSGLHASRAEHAAVTLPRQRLLVVGGWKGDYHLVDELQIAAFEDC